jgi:hypothetical protein
VGGSAELGSEWIVSEQRTAPSATPERLRRAIGPDRWSRFAAMALLSLAVLEVLDGALGAVRAAGAVAGTWSPGVLVHAFDPHLRTALLGLAAWAFVRELWPRAGEITEAHAARIAASVPTVSGRAVAQVGLLVVLAGYRDVMRAELFTSRYGEAQFVGSVSLADALGPATFAALLALSVAAIARWAVGTAREPDRADPGAKDRDGVASRTPSRDLEWVGYGMLVACGLAVRHYFDPSSAAPGGNARVAVIESWQCWLAAYLILGAELPLPSMGGLARWLGRRWQPFALLVALESLRVVWLEDGSRPGFAWLSADRERVPDALVFLTGRIHDWTGIGLATAMLVVALGGWLWGARIKSSVEGA